MVNGENFEFSGNAFAREMLLGTLFHINLYFLAIDDKMIPNTLSILNMKA